MRKPARRERGAFRDRWVGGFDSERAIPRAGAFPPAMRGLLAGWAGRLLGDYAFSAGR